MHVRAIHERNGEIDCFVPDFNSNVTDVANQRPVASRSDVSSAPPAHTFGRRSFDGADAMILTPLQVYGALLSFQLAVLYLFVRLSLPMVDR